MSNQDFEATFIYPTFVERWLRIAVAALVIVVAALIGYVATASADGATQISGIATVAQPGECVDEVTGPAGQNPDYALNLTGDLEGCLYAFVESYSCSSGGVYMETGTEVYVGSGNTGDAGTFATAYRFTGLLGDCPDFGTQVNGRCQHPIAAGSGTGDYEGVTGRIDFKDNIDAGNAPYKGHLRW